MNITRDFSSKISATQEQWEVIDRFISLVEKNDVDHVVKSISISELDVNNGILNNKFMLFVNTIKGGNYFRLIEACDISNLIVEWVASSYDYTGEIVIWKAGA